MAVVSLPATDITLGTSGSEGTQPRPWDAGMPGGLFEVVPGARMSTVALPASDSQMTGNTLNNLHVVRTMDEKVVHSQPCRLLGACRTCSLLNAPHRTGLWRWVLPNQRHGTAQRTQKRIR